MLHYKWETGDLKQLTHTSFYIFSPQMGLRKYNLPAESNNQNRYQKFRLPSDVNTFD